MISLLLSIITYSAITIVNSYLSLQLSIPLFLLTFYVLPLSVNFVIYKIQKVNWKSLTAIVLPTFSLVSYLAFAYITSSNGSWLKFVQINTMSDNNMSLEIATDLFATSQVLFVAVLFYGVSLAHHFISQKVSNKGVQHA